MTRHAPHTVTTSLMLCLVGSCGPVPPSTDTGPVTEDSEDGFNVPDLPEPDLTDPSETGTDTSVSKPTPRAPTAWGPGFVEIPGPWNTHFPPDPGAMAEPRAPSYHRAAVGDVDNDGYLELFVGTQRSDAKPDSADYQRAYRWTDAGVVEAPDIAQSFFGSPLAMQGLIDVDGDGHLDAINQSHEYMFFFGDGSGGVDETKPSGLPLTGGAVVGGASAWADVDGDGWADLLLGRADCGGSLHILRRTGLRTFEPMEDWVDSGTYSGVRTDSILPLALANGTRAMVMVSPTCEVLNAHPGFYIDTGESFAPLFQARPFLGASAWWKLRPEYANGPFTRMTPMSAVTADLNHDGFLDVGITFGAISFGVFAGDGMGGFADAFHPSHLLPQVPNTGFQLLSWGLLAADLDQDGRTDIVALNGDDAASFFQEQGAHIPVLAYWNAGDFVLEDIAAAIGLGANSGHRGLTYFDHGEDGDADILAHGLGAETRLYENRIENGHHGFSLKLQGTSSPHRGELARVEVEVDGLAPQLAQMGAVANPWSISSPLLFFGTGDSAVADLVRITWPSGHVQELYDVSTGTMHTVTEPPLFTLEPASRHVLADGQSAASLHITPRLTDGTLDLQAQVRAFADGVEVPLTQTGKAWTMGITREDPSEVRLSIEVNGQLLPVAPVVWFDVP
ncbi:MAG: ASPIC/UnbV domain-containing protein [Myxococcota bacterium]